MKPARADKHRKSKDKEYSRFAHPSTEMFLYSTASVPDRQPLTAGSSPRRKARDERRLRKLDLALFRTDRAFSPSIHSAQPRSPAEPVRMPVSSFQTSCANSSASNSKLVGFMSPRPHHESLMYELRGRKTVGNLENGQPRRRSARRPQQSPERFRQDTGGR